MNWHSNHWCLAVIYVQKKNIEYFDSYSMNKKQIIYVESSLLDYLKDESDKTKQETPFKIKDWTFTTEKTPMQSNNFDCGVFSIMCAHCISEESVRVFDSNGCIYSFLTICKY